MSCAIKINGSRDIRLIDVAMNGFDVGIDAENSEGIHLKSVDFGTCSTGMKARNVNNINAMSCVHGFEGKLNKSESYDVISAMHYAFLYLHNVYSYNPLR